jgi:hypothetical protein
MLPTRRGGGGAGGGGGDSMYPVSGGFGLAAGGMGMGGESGDFGGSYLMASQSQWLTQYLRRVWSWEQMDFEQCFDQMVTLLGPEPSTVNKVYKMAKIRKKTKNQWARDDPAFALVQVGFLLVSTAAWGVACLSTRFTITKFIFFAVNDFLGYWLAGGIVLSGICASFANHRLIEHSAHSVAQVPYGCSRVFDCDPSCGNSPMHRPISPSLLYFIPNANRCSIQTVEWLYAFDIHCNGFFVSFLFTHVLQFLLLPLLLTDSLAATICADLVWVVALSSYFFVTHLGYRALPFLKHTEYFLYPIGMIILLFVTLVVLAILGYRINITRQMVGFYFGS